MTSISLASAETNFLSVVTHVDEEGDASFWWIDTAKPQWSESDRALQAALAEAGLTVIDPGARTEAVQVSKVVFGKPHLSVVNALNLGTLFDADRVIVGEVKVEQVAPPKLIGQPGCKLVIDLHVYGATSVELMPIRLEEVQYADDYETAKTAAWSRVGERLSALFQNAKGLEEVEVGVELDEPVIVLTGLAQAGPLVAIKKQLKSSAAVADVMEVWAASGALAVELNPGSVDTSQTVFDAADGLLATQFEGFRLYEVRRTDKRVEIAVSVERPAQ